MYTPRYNTLVDFFCVCMYVYTQIEEKEAAQAFEDFVASFEGADSGGKTFVRGSTITPGSIGKLL